MSAGAALLLMGKGFRNVAALKGGYDDWRDAGLPTEPSVDAPPESPTPR